MSRRGASRVGIALPASVRQFPATDAFVVSVAAAFLGRYALVRTAGEATARAVLVADPVHPGRVWTWLLAPFAHDTLSGLGGTLGVGYLLWRYTEYFVGSRHVAGAFLWSGVAAVGGALLAGDATAGSVPGLVGLAGTLAAARPSERFPLPFVPRRAQPPGWLVLAAAAVVGTAVALGVGPVGVGRPSALVGLLAGTAYGRVLARTGRVR